MISFDEAAAIIAAIAKPLASEFVPLGEADGRVLAGDVVAALDSPRCDVSAMDGYAVREADLAQLPARLRVVGEAFAGHAELPQVEPGECARIFTGGALPPAADWVIVQEVVNRDGEWARFSEPLGNSRHIRAQASDFARGEQLLPAGMRLGPRALVAVAAADLARVAVWRQPRLVILSTGDELAEPGSARDGTSTIPESLSVGVAALARQWGGMSGGHVRLRDEPATLERAAAEALVGADLVVVTGGASVGEKDYAKSMFEPLGLELLFTKVAMKPGKPVWLGRVSGKLVLGLPGNPTSAMVTARLLLAPLVAGLAGRDPASALGWQRASLAAPVGACADRETFVRARWAGDQVEPIANQDSGAQKALAGAELLLRRRANSPPGEVGERVEVLPF